MLFRSEILATDGKYKIELTLDGKPRADYTLTVKAGMINGIDPVIMRKENYRIILPLTNERRPK